MRRKLTRENVRPLRARWRTRLIAAALGNGVGPLLSFWLSIISMNGTRHAFEA
jgi:hypothetical protein